MASKKTMSTVNNLPYDEFIALFGGVVERTPLCAAAVWRKRPFNTDEQLYEEFSAFIDQLPFEGREGVLRCHPDLAGRLAEKGEITQESKQEQASAGLTQLSDDEKMRLGELNAKYREKFGFPFVICARENKKEAIFKGLENRLENTEDVELEKGVTEVKKIMKIRLKDILQSSDPKL